MGYTNSPLATYSNLTNKMTPNRNHVIDTITIHCMAGQMSGRGCADMFATSGRDASSNYCVGKDGDIAMSVEEKNRSWCTSNSVNDHRAITIEVASDKDNPCNVTAKAYASLLNLVTDICKRNGIKKLVWSTNKNDRVNHLNGCNMTVHRDYANKACPGDYLYGKHGEIAAEVNKRLGAPEEKQPEPEKPQTIYKVQVGAFSKKDNAISFEKQIKSEGFETYLVNIGGYYKVQVGAFSVKANADAMLKKLIAAGHADAFITTNSSASEVHSKTFKKGDKVKVKSGAKTYTGGSLASFVYKTVYTVIEISGDRVVIGNGGVVTAAVRASDLIAQ